MTLRFRGTAQMRGIERNGNGPNGARTGDARAILVPQPNQKGSLRKQRAFLLGANQDHMHFREPPRSAPQSGASAWPRYRLGWRNSVGCRA